MTDRPTTPAAGGEAPADPARERRAALFSVLLVLLHGAALALAFVLEPSTLRSGLMGINGAGVLVNAAMAIHRLRRAGPRR